MIDNPDNLTISNKDELKDYLIKWAEKYAGWMVDRDVLQKVTMSLSLKAIPYFRKVPPIASIQHHKVNPVAILYMLALSRGAVYGKEFGIWSDNGLDFTIWLAPTPAVAAACDSFNRMAIGMATLHRCEEQLLDKFPLKATEIDKVWHREVSTEARRMTMRGLIRLRELKEKYELIPDLQGELKMVDVSGITYLTDPSKQEDLFEGKLAIPDQAEVELSDEEDYWKPKSSKD